DPHPPRRVRRRARAAGRAHVGPVRGPRSAHAARSLGRHRRGATRRGVRGGPLCLTHGDAGGVGAVVRGTGGSGRLSRPDLAGTGRGVVSLSVPGSRDLPTVDDTRALGAELATLLTAGDVVILDGPLGAGKTALTGGIARGLGVRGRV